MGGGTLGWSAKDFAFREIWLKFREILIPLKSRISRNLNFAKLNFGTGKTNYHSVVPIALCPLSTAHYSIPSALVHCLMPTVYCQPSAAHCPLQLTAHCTAHRLMSTIHRQLPTHCPLPTVNCPLSTAHCLLPTVSVHYLLLRVLFNAHCLLPTVCPLFTATAYGPLSTVLCPLPTSLLLVKNNLDLRSVDSGSVRAADGQCSGHWAVDSR
jgi:hypothetical protein